jgi:hypothetical protein
LSWKRPAVTNGIITKYLILYHSIGPVVVTTPFPPSQPIIEEHIDELLNSTSLLDDIFRTFDESLTEDIFQPLAALCDIILHNETLNTQVENITDIIQSEEVLQIKNISSNAVFDWMENEQIRLGELCLNLRNFVIHLLKGLYVCLTK